MRRKTTFVAMFVAALVAALAFGVASAQEMGGSETLQITPSRDSGVSGTATLTDTADGVVVEFDVQGLPTADGTEHIAHIHAGATCADDRAGNGAPVEIPLNSAFTQGGAGTSETIVPGVTLAGLFDGTPRYINVHAEMPGDGSTPPGIACADLVSTSSGALADTGGFVSPMTALLAGGAALIILGATAGFFLRRRAW